MAAVTAAVRFFETRDHAVAGDHGARRLRLEVDLTVPHQPCVPEHLVAFITPHADAQLHGAVVCAQQIVEDCRASKTGATPWTRQSEQCSMAACFSLLEDDSFVVLVADDVLSSPVPGFRFIVAQSRMATHRPARRFPLCRNRVMQPMT